MSSGSPSKKRKVRSKKAIVHYGSVLYMHWLVSCTTIKKKDREMVGIQHLRAG